MSPMLYRYLQPIFAERSSELFVKAEVPNELGSFASSLLLFAHAWWMVVDPLAVLQTSLGNHVEHIILLGRTAKSVPTFPLSCKPKCLNTNHLHDNMLYCKKFHKRLERIPVDLSSPLWGSFGLSCSKMVTFLCLFIYSLMGIWIPYIKTLYKARPYIKQEICLHLLQ